MRARGVRDAFFSLDFLEPKFSSGQEQTFEVWLEH
jgi:hypothetical protein